MHIIKNPNTSDIALLMRQSKDRTLRRLTDERTGDVYVWDAVDGTHRQGADYVGATYSLKPGQGEILVGDD